MGIEVTYRRLSRSEFERIQNDPEAGVEYLCADLPGFDMDALMKLAQDPEAMQAKGPDILAAFQKQSEDPTRVDLSKDWQALHYLLTGDGSMELVHRDNEPLRNVVMGGHATGLETGYGPARFFNTEEIKTIAEELGKISIEDLRSRFSAAAFNAARIYPNPRPGGWTEEQIEGVFHVFPKLVRFFKEASDAGEIVLVYAA